jgi:hypothetical protein
MPMRPSLGPVEPIPPLAPGTRVAGGAVSALLLAAAAAEIIDPHINEGKYMNGLVKALGDCQMQKMLTTNTSGPCCGCCEITIFYGWQFRARKKGWFDDGYWPASGNQYFAKADGVYHPQNCESITTNPDTFRPEGFDHHTHSRQVIKTSF